jgi:hypothetical protein
MSSNISVDFIKAVSEELTTYMDNTIETLKQEIPELYDTQFKEAVDKVTLINDEPKHNEPQFLQKKINSKININETKKYTLDITIDTDNYDDTITMLTQDIGTGDGINEYVLNSFSVLFDLTSSGISKWYMNPTYNLKNFIHILNTKLSKGITI